MPARLEGKIAIVTGASSGIGRSITETFAAHGAKVVAIDLAAPKDGAAFPPGVEFFAASVTDVEVEQSSTAEEPRFRALANARASDANVWTRALETGRKAFGATPDVLVNSAGITYTALLHEQTDEGFDRTFDINFKAPMKGMQVLIGALLEEKRGGNIINISSIAGVNGLPTKTAYGVSKAAISHLTKIAAKEYGEKGIRVNAIAPSMIRTDRTAFMNSVLHLTALNRWGEPQEIANAALFLAAVIRVLLAEKRPGSIVNVSSVRADTKAICTEAGQIAGERAFPFTPAYNTSKAAVSHLTRSAASEFGDKGTRVNAVALGMVLTAMTRDTIHERQGLVDHHTALKRVVAAEEMAASIVYLASDDASYITGHVLVNDGGRVLT
ncbi:3-oxoacyl-[acyl-carrier-protein] reductase FabG [Vanrija pseudolonga]|uniref:3-oxoacyl-[acyl-carrier-protein] reductase FabG n=1 Tax=Vanrija pseudolonga TaxID=143232 RepID=A0AAF1BNQ5_9TREE|nr:3-oxoacyl-[acyl-carrier-protein] reductase FabG [Vanrija pseudolonga]